MVSRRAAVFAHRRDAGRPDAGFTLVEVLVAFFISALTLVMALRVLGEGAGWARRGPAAAARMEEAASVVDTLLTDPALRPGERDGVFADGQRWRATVVDVTGALVARGAPAQLLRVDLSSSGNSLLVTLGTAGRVAR